MPRQRWFGAAAGSAVGVVDVVEHPSTDPGAQIQTLFVAADGPVYQVPTVRREPGASIAATGGVIGTAGGRVLIDGPHDRAYQHALLAELGAEVAATPGTVLTGEQSNTSVIVGGDSPIIVKVFRRLTEGSNPDVELQTLLDTAPTRLVPPVVGSVHGSWSDPADPARRCSGTLAFAQSCIDGAEDGWTCALRAVSQRRDFAGSAGALGTTVARVHAALRELLGTQPVTGSTRSAIAETWRARLAAAVAAAPGLAAHVPAIEARYAAAAATPWPQLQRIHGDLDLGQTLRTPSDSWLLIDFEGEPMRPISERRSPDLAVRDVAGMLRSFDYAARSGIRLQSATEPGASAWAAAARAAFLSGYRATSGTAVDPALLTGLELDKAVYEVTYESRYRPGWAHIPLSAVERLTQA